MSCVTYPPSKIPITIKKHTQVTIDTFATLEGHFQTIFQKLQIEGKHTHHTA